MTQPDPDFPDIQRLLADLFAPLVGGADHVGSETPPDLEAHLPFARAVRIGGPRTHLYDFPTVDVDYFHVSDALGVPGSSRLANLLLSKPPPHPALDLVSCEPVFRELPWGDNENVRRWGATFFFETRRIRAAS